MVSKELECYRFPILLICSVQLQNLMSVNVDFPLSQHSVDMCNYYGFAKLALIWCDLIDCALNRTEAAAHYLALVPGYEGSL